MKVRFQTGVRYATTSFVLLYASCLLVGQGMEIGKYLFFSLPASLIIGLVGAMICRKEAQYD